MWSSWNHTKAFAQCCHDKYMVASSWTLLSDHVYSMMQMVHNPTCWNEYNSLWTAPTAAQYQPVLSNTAKHSVTEMDICTTISLISFFPNGYRRQYSVRFDKVIYSITHNTFIVINTQLATCFSSSEPLQANTHPFDKSSRLTYNIYI
jgi:hypothetical protein